MSDLISSLANVMQAEINTLDVIAQNSANANTTAYRSQRSVINQPSFLQFIAAPENTKTHSGDAISRPLDSSPPAMHTKLLLSDGSLSMTQAPLDFALTGDAWFGIQHPEGLQLTRNGHFHLDDNGTLVTTHGYPVLGSDMQTINGLTLQSRIDSDGQLVDGNQKLLILRALDSNSIVPQGEGLYLSHSGVDAAQNYQVIQGALEGSNVDIGNDMVRLLQTTRHIESLQRAMSSYDSIMESGINQIGN
ncbi:MAG: hypothetical protein COA42_21310 [Alteromonadaceae bacterium]|nr:MAG: hypothetical protein COA42_21310 [Alteromonadaceae bacterium]